MKKKQAFFLFVVCSYKVEAKLCAFHLKHARSIGLIAPAIHDEDFMGNRLKTYKEFQKGREVEVLGEGSFAMVVRELSPKSRVAKIYDDTAEGKAELVQNANDMDLFREYAAAQGDKHFSVPAILGREGSILYLQDIAGSDMASIAMQPSKIRDKQKKNYMMLVNDLGLNFENFVTSKGHTVISKEVFTSEEIPQYSSFRMITLDQNGEEHEFRVKADNVVYDVSGGAWIIDPR